MAERSISYALYCAAYFVEVALFIFLCGRGRWRRLQAVFLYVVSLLVIDGVGRSYVLYRYGVHSREYAYFFWLTDVLLGFVAFLLVCAFLRRACAQQEKMWRFVRLMLVFIFLLVLGISFLTLSRNYSQLFTSFIVEVGQNLYFTNLVLNTLLYILLQHLQSTDDELGLLVCGLGIQFAGPAASLALFHLTAGQSFARSLTTFIMPFCNLGMLLIWIYAVAWVPKAARVPATERKVFDGEEFAVSKA